MFALRKRSETSTSDVNPLEKASSMVTKSLDIAPLMYLDSGKVVKAMDYTRKKQDICYSNFAKQVSRDQKFVSPDRSIVEPGKY